MNDIKYCEEPDIPIDIPIGHLPKIMVDSDYLLVLRAMFRDGHRFRTQIHLSDDCETLKVQLCMEERDDLVCALQKEFGAVYAGFNHGIPQEE